MYCWLLLQIYFMTDFVVQGHIFYKSFIALDIGVSQLSAWLFIDADKAFLWVSAIFKTDLLIK